MTSATNLVEDEPNESNEPNECSPEADHVLDAPGLACIRLTPLIKVTIDSLEAGDVLSVRTDDPTAREGVPAWCRLTKNTLLDVVEHNETQTTFYLRSKAKT